MSEKQEPIGLYPKADAEELAQLRASHTQLLAECAAVKLALSDSIAEHKRVLSFLAVRIADGERCFLWHETTEELIAKLEAVLSTPTGQELLDDKARIEWLDEDRDRSVRIVDTSRPIRDAIDDARKGAER